jgi:hypothetical protein
MRCANRMIVVAFALAALGCTTSAGRTYRSDEWKAGGPLGNVLMIVPEFRAGSGGQPSDKDVRIEALRQRVGRQRAVALDARRLPQLGRLRLRRVRLIRAPDDRELGLVEPGGGGFRFTGEPAVCGANFQAHAVASGQGILRRMAQGRPEGGGSC